MRTFHSTLTVELADRNDRPRPSFSPGPRSWKTSIVLGIATEEQNLNKIELETIIFTNMLILGIKKAKQVI
jgi:hypothetical protein